MRKGDRWKTDQGTGGVARTGSWRLVSPRRRPGDLDRQIAELLDRLSDDLSVWRELTGRFRADLFCGLFLQERNEGLSLSPSTMAAVGARGLELGLDIYGRERPG